MTSFLSRSLRMRSAIAIALLAAVVLFVRADAPVAGGYAKQMLHENHDAGAPMTDEAMAQWVREYYASNPENRPTAATGAPVVTFRAFSSDFDIDSNPSGTPVDTAFIMVGETVRWQRLIGIHTVTDGTGLTDPAAGALFDVAHDAANPIFDFTFTQAGTVPFFCRVHENLNMRGVVVVAAPVDVTPLPGYGTALGFTNGPFPNPTLDATAFRFALREAGAAKAIVLDAGGRRVTDLVDETLLAGTYGARWDGRDALGHRAQPGIYFIHLILPGYQSAKQVVLTR
jgi:plastocyanin